MSNILITGGAGFIGSNFVHYWQAKHPKDTIVVLDKLTYAGSLTNLEDILDKIIFVHGDICNPVDVTKAMSNCNTVVHFAAESHVDRSILDPQTFIRTNVLGTGVLLDLAQTLGVERFHHVSTDEVYGHLALDSQEKWTEQSPYRPRSPYSASKAGADHLVRAHHTTYYETGKSKLKLTITNCANNIGPYMFPEKLIPLAITNVFEGKKIPIYKPGNQVREWLYVEDHCRAIDLILRRGRAGETYFVGPDNPELSNLEVICKLLALMGEDEKWIEFVGDRPGHDQKYALNHSKITHELGWRPQYKLRESLEMMVEWYGCNQDWWRPLKKRNQEYFKENYGKRS